VKPKLFALLLAALIVLAGVVLILRGAATAAIPSSTTPYPSVAINPAVCQAEAIRVQQAQNTYNNAMAHPRINCARTRARSMPPASL
jgi:hypothetical protein